MDALFALSWRAYPASLLLVAGLTMSVWSVRRGLSAARHEARDPRRALALLRGFRGAVVGLALIIGGQELLEATVVIAALRQGVRRPI
jgi:hypothetical protein